MTEAERAAEFARIRLATLRYHFAILGLMLVGLVGLAVYTLQLGPITGPGVESSFGIAAGLMLIMGAMIVHVVERTYRLYPLGRKTATAAPPPVTEGDLVTFVKVLVVLIAAAAVAYILGSLITA